MPQVFCLSFPDHQKLHLGGSGFDVLTWQLVRNPYVSGDANTDVFPPFRMNRLHILSSALYHITLKESVNRDMSRRYCPRSEEGNRLTGEYKEARLEISVGPQVKENYVPGNGIFKICRVGSKRSGGTVNTEKESSNT